MAYETKILIIALSKIVRKADDLMEVYEALQEMANAEGVILQPFDEKKKEDK